VSTATQVPPRTGGSRPLSLAAFGLSLAALVVGVLLVLSNLRGSDTAVNIGAVLFVIGLPASLGLMVYLTITSGRTRPNS
jgi:hypothetical protein